MTSSYENIQRSKRHQKKEKEKENQPIRMLIFNDISQTQWLKEKGNALKERKNTCQTRCCSIKNSDRNIKMRTHTHTHTDKHTNTHTHIYT